MIRKQHGINKQMVDLQTNFFKMTSESLQKILSSIPIMMRQYAIEAQTLNPVPLNSIAPQLMLTMANFALAPSTLLMLLEYVVLSPAPFGVTTSVQVPKSLSSTPQSSELAGHSKPSNV